MSIRLTVSTKWLVTIVAVTRHDQSARCATSLTFAYGFYLCGNLLVVSEIRPTSKMSVTFVAGETNFGELARKANHAIAARLVTDVLFHSYKFCCTPYRRTLAPVTFVNT